MQLQMHYNIVPENLHQAVRTTDKTVYFQWI